MNNLLDFKNFIQLFEKENYPQYRWDQFLTYYFSLELNDLPNWQDLTTWPKNMREKFANKIDLNNIIKSKIKSADNNRSHKALLTLQDKKLIESVLMSYKDHNTVCLSSQIGCPLNCQFCATGKAGFERNLKVVEIIEQFQYWLVQVNNKDIKVENPNTYNLVFMGMGEPFLNWNNVKDAIYLFNHYYNISFRRITVSTAGLIKGIKEFANEDWPVNLAISLNAGSNRVRNILMPINESNPLNKLWSAIRYYFKRNNRKVFLEYILIDDFNDSLEEISEVVAKIKQISPKLLHLNLIPYNPVKGKPWSTVKPKQLQRIIKYLENEHIHFTVRDSLGADVNAACGQLKHNELYE